MSATRMITEKQLAANRANAQKSTGPTTEAGKAICARNGQTHGLTGQILSMSPEERAAYDRFTAEYIAALNPGSFMETHLAQSIADTEYRLSRSAAIEHNIYALAEDINVDSAENRGLSNARTFLADHKKITLLPLYENRLQRTLKANLARFCGLKAQRLASETAALEQATNLAEASYTRGDLYDPAEDFPTQNGSGFSIAKINETLRRQNREDRDLEAQWALWEGSHSTTGSELASEEQDFLEEAAKLLARAA